jgi:hypothetical protein
VLLRSILVSLTVAASAMPVPAADLAAIKREIAKEPKYQATPRYCLLVFGKEANTRICMVQDGNRLYVDRNGNGDLTDPGELLTSDNPAYFHFDQIVERDGTVHKGLTLSNRGDGTFQLELGENDRHAQHKNAAAMVACSVGQIFNPAG